MKTQTSKVVVLCLAGAIAVTAALLPNRGGDVFVGAGSKADEEITTIEQVSALLESFEDQLTGYRAPVHEDDALSLTASRVSSTQESGENDDERPVYTSVTLTETSSYDITYSSSYQTTVDGETVTAKSSAALKGKRTLSIYISEDAVYYVSDLTIVQSSSSFDGKEETEHSAYISGLMKIYMSKETIALRMDRFSAIHDGEAVTGVSKFLGQWIDMTASDDLSVQAAVDGLISVNDKNFDIFALMAKYIAEKDKAFTKQDDAYTMKEETFKSFLKDVFHILGVYGINEKTSGSFSVDLYDPVKPMIFFDLSEEYNYREQSKSASASCSESDDFIFSNINNTVIGKPNMKNALDPVEFEKMIEEAMDI